jgi:mannose-1-phosphate guanylyltransferase/mannose-6-phosphate isomerase
MDEANKSVLQPVILAGGGGTRLWPLSREHYPKQFLNLFGGETLLQQTVRRLEGLHAANAGFSILAPLIICNEEHRFLVAEQARLLESKVSRIVLEPAGRNTAPALTVAALIIVDTGTDPVLLMMPADHVIQDVPRFHEAVTLGLALAQAGSLVTFGITPVRPETGYGYIATGDVINNRDGARAVKSFVEKPDEATARCYLESGRYLWNSGIFMMKASIWLAAIGQFRPEILAACRAACAQTAADDDFLRLDAAAFNACPSDSVDYAVMEKVVSQAGFNAAVVTLAAGWSDIGAWSSLWEISQRDPQGNVTRGDICAIDSTNNALLAEHRLLAVLGCEDLVVVETADAVMVTKKNRAQDIKRIVEWLKTRGREERLSHRKVYRPWGSYESVDAGEGFQVKRLTVKAGEKLSLQMHHQRAEHWIVVQGAARVTRGEEVFLLSENQSTYIPLGVKHRLENPGNMPLELIEVQSGPYLGEDDIIRFEDLYHRN